jgi:hypothetical protein
MIGFLRRFQLRRAFRSYIYKLGPALENRYGGSEQYTVLQIRETVSHLKLNSRHLAYAVALYRHEQSQDMVDLLRFDQSFLSQLRSEIADAVFGGNSNYRASDVLALSRQGGWKGGPPPDWRLHRHGKTNL